MQVLNIRGTTSSGKTTLVRKLIATSTENDIISITSKVKGHMLDNIVTIGTYKKGSKFGGVDSIDKISYVEEAIMKALTMKPIVVFEGLLVSHSFDRWRDNSKKFMKIQSKYGAPAVGMIWIFTVPTFRENLRRLAKRNNIKGSVREAKGDKFIMNFVQRYKSMQRILKKATHDGQSLLILPNDGDPFERLQNYIFKIRDDKLLPIKKSGIRRLL